MAVCKPLLQALLFMPLGWKRIRGGGFVKKELNGDRIEEQVVGREIASLRFFTLLRFLPFCLKLNRNGYVRVLYEFHVLFENCKVYYPIFNFLCELKNSS